MEANKTKTNQPDTINPLTDTPVTQPQNTTEQARPLKRLKTCAILFAISLLLDVLAIFVMRQGVSVLMIGMALMKMELIRQGWKAGKDDQHIKTAVSVGRMAWIMFAVVAALQAVIAAPYSRLLGAMAWAGCIEMLLLMALAWCYYRFAKQAMRPESDLISSKIK